jgi:hypothetical protein
MTAFSLSPADELEPVDVVRELELAAKAIREIRLGYIERRDKINREVDSYRLGDRSDPELESAGWQDDVERWDDVQEESDEDSSAYLSAGKTERMEGLQSWRLVGCVFLPFAAGYYDTSDTACPAATPVGEAGGARASAVDSGFAAGNAPKQGRAPTGRGRRVFLLLPSAPAGLY